MATSKRDDDGAEANHIQTGADTGVDPEDTEHPTGAKQAAQNTAEESPS